MRGRSQTSPVPAFLAALLLSAGQALPQVDQPHGAAQNINCMSCHLSHDLFGSMVDSKEGSPNLCLSCHHAGGLASKYGLAEKRQSSLPPDAPNQQPPNGNSHRWDSGHAGLVEALGGAPEGALAVSGLYTGRYAFSYTITVDTPGASGEARFSWARTGPGTAQGAGVLTGSSVPLEYGIMLSFVAPPGSGFVAGNQWRVRVRAGLNAPSNPDLLSQMPAGKTVCSTCHDPHSQVQEPFDTAAPPYTPGEGAGRHFLRAACDLDQMCAECHASRFVTNSSAGSHPVAIAVSSNALLHPPRGLPLDKSQGRMRCQTCHQIHNSASQDGSLTRKDDQAKLCAECHALADIAGPASHLNSASGPLWPGSKYGSLRPGRSDIHQRGACANCHAVHGWPDPASPTNDYPNLLVEREENLCYSCHDGSTPAKNVRSISSKTYNHPVSLAGRHLTSEDGQSARYGSANRHSECADCHNVHQLTPDPVAPKAPFASASLKGVARVSVNNVSSTSVSYQFRPASDPTPIKEYELCFLCHSGWTTQPAGQTNHAAKFNDKNPSYHPVEAVGKNLNINTVTFTNGWTETSLVYCTDCHTSDDAAIRGPHGSANQWILKKPYTRASTPALASNGLCFECHSYAVYGANAAGSRFRNVSRTGHNHGGYNCFACHESHGSSTKPFLLGNSITTYTKTATGGTCDPSCHGSESYTVAYPR